jgi:Bacterial toxin 23
LQNFRARFYDEDLFRFYAMDPAGQQISPYAFVGSSPLMMIDKNGEEFFTAMLIASAIYGSVNLGADLIRNDFKMNIGQIGKSFGMGAFQGALAVATMGKSELANLQYGQFALNSLSSAVSSQLPGISGNGWSINPTFSFGTGGISFGFNASAYVRAGDFTMGMGIGGGYNANSVRKEIAGFYSTASAFTGVQNENYHIMTSWTSFNHHNGIEKNPFNQTLNQTSFGGKSWSLAYTNDQVLPLIGKVGHIEGTDKGRTAALDISLGNFSVGMEILTNDKLDGPPIGGQGTSVGTQIWGDNPEGFYLFGDVYFSPGYFGFRGRNGNVHRVGWNHPAVQDFFQNGIHSMVGSPYFYSDYNSFSNPYFSTSRRGRFIY